MYYITQRGEPIYTSLKVLKTFPTSGEARDWAINNLLSDDCEQTEIRRYPKLITEGEKQ